MLFKLIQIQKHLTDLTDLTCGNGVVTPHVYTDDLLGVLGDFQN